MGPWPEFTARATPSTLAVGLSMAALLGAAAPPISVVTADDGHPAPIFVNGLGLNAGERYSHLPVEPVPISTAAGTVTGSSLPPPPPGAHVWRD